MSEDPFRGVDRTGGRTTGTRRGSATRCPDAAGDASTGGDGEVSAIVAGGELGMTRGTTGATEAVGTLAGDEAVDALINPLAASMPMTRRLPINATARLLPLRRTLASLT